ncbi:DUF6220 domain-containing protein [Epibacterium sp. Ofav1-8]|uniref:DUF6220 domain-containing protein n=1 Tax=Epibacterium sp. Ofav1-8 TaxID=2917735 RepID=UPI001EF4F1E3|nr:DUF6220 domain-containing protein [Epibacterium sp. Ofav1-8]MCG7625889.1 DUF6220 domain-containing protein [Epibacterium sp. Ofav1-8]
MDALKHDTLKDLEQGTPALFLWSARTLPALLGAQFLLAGLALFGGMSWEFHGLVGGIVGLPVFALVGSAFAVARLRGFCWWAGLTLILYITQVVLAIDNTSALAIHPFNGALLLTLALVILAKVERRNALH